MIALAASFVSLHKIYQNHLGQQAQYHERYELSLIHKGVVLAFKQLMASIPNLDLNECNFCFET